MDEQQQNREPYEWSPENESLVVPQQDAIQIYPNPNGDICLKQYYHGAGDDEHFVWFHVQHAERVAEAILQLAKRMRASEEN